MAVKLNLVFLYFCSISVLEIVSVMQAWNVYIEIIEFDFKIYNPTGISSKPSNKVRNQFYSIWNEFIRLSVYIQHNRNNF